VTQAAVVMAKLAGIRKAVVDVMGENVSRARSKGEVLTRTNFAPDEVQHYFTQTATLVQALKTQLPDLYGDLQDTDAKPNCEMSPKGPLDDPYFHYSRSQLQRLVRDIDQIFEVRANSELESPKPPAPRRVFISHGRSEDWRRVQPFIEKDVGLGTLELAQEANHGRTIIEKLLDNANRCDSAVIVMTGDDLIGDDERRVRENVMHEIGFFQGRYGRTLVVLMHEEGVNVPSNLAGVAYVPFPKGRIEAGFHVLHRELDAIYKDR
jgi:predicted nucleotide-binding protein